jgi:hypothetical protein
MSVGDKRAGRSQRFLRTDQISAAIPNSTIATDVSIDGSSKIMSHLSASRISDQKSELGLA